MLHMSDLLYTDRFFDVRKNANIFSGDCVWWEFLLPQELTVIITFHMIIMATKLSLSCKKHALIIMMMKKKLCSVKYEQIQFKWQILPDFYCKNLTTIKMRGKISWILNTESDF